MNFLLFCCLFLFQISFIISSQICTNQGQCLFYPKTTWVDVSSQSDFPIQNLPIGIFSFNNKPKRAGMALGDYVIDLSEVYSSGLLKDIDYQVDINLFALPTLNTYAELGKDIWRQTRARIAQLFTDDEEFADNTIKNDSILKSKILLPTLEDPSFKLHLPLKFNEFTDFYSSKEHAINVGTMFRGKDNAIQPNWYHLPVGYQARASTVSVSGENFYRPVGQRAKNRKNHKEGSVFLPTKALDFELELGIIIGGKANQVGNPIKLDEAEERIFGIVLLNDWSARDVQNFEYVPLGPFTSKNFFTSISPWVVDLDALEPYRVSSSEGSKQSEVLPHKYLEDKNYFNSFYNINLSISLQGENDKTDSIISQTNSRHLYWNFKQQIVHHTITGCQLNSGDLLGTGTISGTTVDSLGSLLELSWMSTRHVILRNSSSPSPSYNENSLQTEGLKLTNVRTYLEDGDRVTLRGYAANNEVKIGFGHVTSKILPYNPKLNEFLNQY